MKTLLFSTWKYNGKLI